MWDNHKVATMLTVLINCYNVRVTLEHSQNSIKNPDYQENMKKLQF